MGCVLRYIGHLPRPLDVECSDTLCPNVLPLSSCSVSMEQDIRTKEKLFVARSPYGSLPLPAPVAAKIWLLTGTMQSEVVLPAAL